VTVLIGRGELVAIQILKELFPSSAVVEMQVPLYKLLLPQYREGLSERQQKETIDIVVNRRHKRRLCVRIQDAHHSNNTMSKIDKIQRNLLEYSWNDVIDVEERECPELFKDNLNGPSRKELKYYMKSYL